MADSPVINPIEDGPLSPTVENTFPALLANPALLGILTESANSIGETYSQLLTQVLGQLNLCGGSVTACYTQVANYLQEHLGMAGNAINAAFQAMSGDIRSQVGVGMSGFAADQRLCFNDVQTICSQLAPGTFARFNNIFPVRPPPWNFEPSYADWIAQATPTYVRDSACAVVDGVALGLDAILHAWNGVAYSPSSNNVAQIQADLAAADKSGKPPANAQIDNYTIVVCGDDGTGDFVGPLPPRTGGGTPTEPPKPPGGLLPNDGLIPPKTPPDAFPPDTGKTTTCPEVTNPYIDIPPCDTPLGPDVTVPCILEEAPTDETKPPDIPKKDIPTSDQQLLVGDEELDIIKEMLQSMGFEHGIVEKFGNQIEEDEPEDIDTQTVGDLTFFE